MPAIPSHQLDLRQIWIDRENGHPPYLSKILPHVCPRPEQRLFHLPELRDIEIGVHIQQGRRTMATLQRWPSSVFCRYLVQLNLCLRRRSYGQRLLGVSTSHRHGEASERCEEAL
jgi:hypothetical protein